MADDLAAADVVPSTRREWLSGDLNHAPALSAAFPSGSEVLTLRTSTARVADALIEPYEPIDSIGNAWSLIEPVIEKVVTRCVYRCGDRKGAKHDLYLRVFDKYSKELEEAVNTDSFDSFAKSLENNLRYYIRDGYRKDRTRKEKISDWPGYQYTPLRGFLSDPEKIARVNQFINSLGEKAQKVIELILQSRTYEQITGELEISEPTISRRLQEIIKLLDEEVSLQELSTLTELAA